MSDEHSGLIRVPVFNGKEKNFQSWCIKFQAYARVKGFHVVLKDTKINITKAEIDVLEVQPSFATRGSRARTADKEKQLKLAKKNLNAMAHLAI